MKTCSFHPMMPRSDHEHIFALQAPAPRFGMTQCGDRDCRLCFERSDLTGRLEPAMIFVPRQMHRFVNGYEIYLNADVVRVFEEVDE